MTLSDAEIEAMAEELTIAINDCHNSPIPTYTDAEFRKKCIDIK